MPEPQPDLDTLNKLAGVGGLGVTWVVGTNLYVGPVRPQAPAGQPGPPAQAVFVVGTGGPPPAPYLGGVSGGSLYTFGIQVRIRSAPADFAGGQVISRNVRALLHKQAPTGYVSMLAKQSDPIYLDRDREGNHEWSINFDLVRTGTP